MKTRYAQLRQRDRRVLLWSIAVAAILHVAAFVLWPAFQVEPWALRNVGVSPGSSGTGAGAEFDLFFGPPDIFEVDGSLSREAPDRFLEVDRIVRVSSDCSEEGRAPASGKVGLTLSASGRVHTVELVESTGGRCGDEVIVAVASDLLYRWLPSERFPAPVRLIQPITVSEKRH